jgi:SAM-dependent methyltransferase
MQYVYSRPTSTAFTGKGLLGYAFGPLNHDAHVYYIEVEKGHDVFMISRKIRRLYYVLSGSGYFTIAGERHDVSPGMLVEAPPKVEYCYSGKMTLLAFSNPGWFSGNDKFTKWNPDVVGADFACAVDDQSALARLVRWRVLGKSPVNAWMRINQRLWRVLPSSIKTHGPVRRYGELLHATVRAQGGRAQAFSTFFLRNRPELELIWRLLAKWEHGATLRVAVLACSTGAEAYSVAWRIRSARPDLKLVMCAVDISRQAVDCARRGKYPLQSSELTSTGIFERMTPQELEEIFDCDEKVARVKPWIGEGIEWHVGDAGDSELPGMLGPQDMVVANNFLCHMESIEAERCLRNIARLLSPHGYLFVSGIDLDVRARVAADLGWHPVEELLEEIHEGDQCMRKLWPFHYGGLEPLTRKRSDWKIRYASVFEIGADGCEVGEPNQRGRQKEWVQAGTAMTNAG